MKAWVVALGLMAPVASASPPVTRQLSNGAELSVEVQQPTHDQEFRVPVGTPGIQVSVSGSAGVGTGEADATLVYVIDESGSTGLGGGTGCSPILDCEEKFFVALNAAALADGSTDLAGVVRYDSSATIGAPLTSPADPSINAAILAAAPAGATNCAAGLQSALSLVTSPANTNGTTIVVFASDGLCNAGGPVASAAAALGATGAIVHSVAIGSLSNCSSNGGTGTLNDIPRNGGTCTEVADPGNLPNIIQNLVGSTLQSLALQHNGGTPSAIPGSAISLPLPQPGAVSVSYGPVTLEGLAPATHNLCVAAQGSDVLGDVQTVTDCHDIQLLQLTAGPASDANNLNFQSSHTVSANIVGGVGPARPLSFSVGGQNASTAAPGSATVSATPNTPVSFTYAVPQDCASLGTDVLTVSTEIGGAAESITLSKTWYDDVPPQVACTPSVNPHGKAPRAQNEDGFYALTATDPHLANCTVTLTVTDGQGFTFPGPFKPGDVVKYTQARGATPQQKAMGSSNGNAGAVLYHLIGRGDLVVTGTDPSGNAASATCFVAPPPK